MKQLTVEQELRLIQAIYDNDDYIDHGGGRMVFDLPFEFYKELGLDCEYVVKVAIGEKGLSQNILEIKSYNEYHNKVALAQIPYYGQVVEIMEKVDTSLGDYIYDVFNDEEEYSPRSFCYALCECYEDDMTGREILKAAESLSDLLDDLERINGYTIDNAQIGINNFGRCVAYDFGFDRELGCREQCSDTSEYVCDEVHRHTILNLIMEIANDSPDLFTEDHVEFMAEVERQFFDDDEDSEEEDICGYDDEESEDNTDTQDFFVTLETLNKIASNDRALDFIKWDKELTAMKWNDYIQPIEYQLLTHILPVKTYISTAIFNDWQFKNFLTDREKDTIISYK